MSDQNFIAQNSIPKTKIEVTYDGDLEKTKKMAGIHSQPTLGIVPAIWFSINFQGFTILIFFKNALPIIFKSV